MHLPTKPEEWPAVFADRVNVGDLEGALELYEPTARIVPPSSNVAVGLDGVREALAKMIATKAKFESKVVRILEAGEFAMLYTDWRVTMNDPSMAKVENAHKAVEVLRRQNDGSWKLILGDPRGREVR